MKDSRENFTLRWLLSGPTPISKPCAADAIFVLAGGQDRKNFGLQLFRQGLAPRILLSVGRFEIRRFGELVQDRSVDLLSMALDIPPRQRHFFVHFHGTETDIRRIRPGRFGTLREMKAFRKWLEENRDIASVLIVSSGIHLKRLRVCAGALFSRRINVQFCAAPVGFRGEAEPLRWRPVILEYLKLGIYRTLLTIPIRR